MSSQDFSDFEREGWSRPETVVGYDEGLSAVTNQAVEAMLDAAGVAAGVSVLDVATGSGYAASRAARRGAHPVGVDFSMAQLCLARRRHPGLRFERGDAQDLPFPDSSFDAVVCNFGIPHFPDPSAFLRESDRVLRRGGRLAFVTWAPPTHQSGLAMLDAAVRDHGDARIHLPSAPDFFQFADPVLCERTLTAAGFVWIKTSACPLVWRLDSPDQLLDTLINGSVRMSAVLSAQSPGALALIRAAIKEALGSLKPAGVVEVMMPALIASGQKR